MRRILSAIGTAALLLSLPATALAVKPDRAPLELPPQLDFTAGDVCPFAVHVEFIVNREKVMTFVDNGGAVVRQLTTGAFKVRLSPVSDPEQTVTLNISGPAHQVFHEDGTSTLTYAGRSISLYPPGTFVLTAGRAVVELDAKGDFVSVTNIGVEQDVCAVLEPAA